LVAAGSDRVGETPLLQQLQRTPAAEREGAVLAHLQAEIQRVLALPQLPDPEVGLVDLGIDSLMAVELRNRLQRQLGVSLSATLVFDHPSIRAMATQLAAQILGSAVEQRIEPSERPQRAAAAEAIAVVGLSCRFPGARNAAEFWGLLERGVDAISTVPADRWDADAYYDSDPNAPGKVCTRWGGFVDGIYEFDPQLFGLAPREVVSMDPQHRLLLWR
jgi:acyl carrier protein